MTQFAHDQQFSRAADQASGVGGSQQGMAPYPLYGLPTLGQTQETPVPFYRRPMVVFVAGSAVGFGLGYLVFGRLIPKLKKNWAKAKEQDAG